MENRVQTRVYRSTADFEQNAAQEIADVLKAAISERGMCFVVLAGGETPRHIYRHLGREPLKSRVNWNRVHLFFSDERSVPPTAPESNYGMAEMSLISWIDIPRENVHRMKGEIDPVVAAEEYECEIRTAFGERPVRFDLVILGIGEDGHTASLFPGSSVLEEIRALVRPVSVLNQNLHRLTLTFAGINSAREIIFLASGKQKAQIVQRVLGNSKPLKELPATLVRPIEGKLRWMLDEDAASQVKPGGGSISRPSY